VSDVERLPVHKLGCIAKDRTGSIEFKFVLGFDRSLFTGLVELQRIVREEIEQRWPVAVRRATFLEQVVVVADWRRLEDLFVGERNGEVFVDLGEDAR